SFSWHIDFGTQRVRKESELTNGFYYGEDGCELALEYSLKLYADQKFRAFCPKDRHPKKSQEASAIVTDVTLYEDGSHPFLFTFYDLPLLWTAGVINGRYPSPEQMKQTEDAEAWSYRGPAEWKGRKCIVLTTKEQRMPSGVRELWVSTDRQYPIV